MSTSLPGHPGEPWSRGVRRRDDGVVEVAGVDVRTLAAEHGTPAYVLDEADFRARARAYRTAFETAFRAVGSDVDVYYAGKALLTVAVARWAREEGLRVDTASGESSPSRCAPASPVPRSACTATTSPTPRSGRARRGVGRIIVDSLVEVERVARLAGSAASSRPSWSA